MQQNGQAPGGPHSPELAGGPTLAAGRWAVAGALVARGPKRQLSSRTGMQQEGLCTLEQGQAGGPPLARAGGSRRDAEAGGFDADGV